MDSPPLWIEELAASNDVPSLDAVQEIKTLLIKPMKDLETLDAAIRQVKNHLSELESERNKTEKRVSLYHSILAPIRRVPPDVLREIFYHCLPTHRNPIMRSDDCPLLLTHICSPWRSVAIASRRLWDRLYFAFTDGDAVPDVETAAAMARNREIESAMGWSKNAPSKPEKERATLVLRRRYNAMKEWIFRAGTRPLSLSVLLWTQIWYTVPYSKRPPSVTTDFFSFLATLSPRVKTLELQTSLPIYSALEKMLSASNMTALTSLRVSLHLGGIGTMPTTSQPFELIQAPNLQRLSISGDDLRIWGINDASLKCQWHKLTNLSCMDALTFHDAVFLLERSSNLVHFKGVVAQNVHNDSPPIFYEGHISLPFLQTLSISEDMKPGHMGNFYHRIDAPSLQSVKYHNQGLSASTLAPPISILPLLQKSTELQKLTVDIPDFTYCESGPLFRAVPTITHLVIGQNDREDSWPYIPSEYGEDGVLVKPSWSLRNLIVDHTTEGDLEHTLLPHLTSLEITSTAAWITEDIIFDIVRSRMLPTTRNTALKHVKVRFYEKRTRDIEERLNDCADYLGVKINLNIKYPPPTPPDMNPISAEFGLIGPFGMSWPHVDAGEDLQIW